MRKITGLLVAVVVGGTVALSILYYAQPNLRPKFIPKKSTDTSQAQAPASNPENDLKKAQTYLSISRPQDAIQLIHRHQQEIDKRTPEGKQWLALLVEASMETHDTAQLMQVFAFDPEALSKNENAALLVAEQLIAQNAPQDYIILRNLWSSNATQMDRWFVLDADALILQEKTPEAIKFLQSKTFAGQQDTGRLVRLALLHMNDQPKTAWNYLTEAQTKNPDSTDVRGYRARYLETIGKPQLALSEYLAAVASDPSNPYLKDQLADFYIRTKKYAQAMQLWSENLTPPTLDVIWLKEIFWNKIIAPIRFDWSGTSVPDGHSAPLVNYLLGLQEGQFWNQATLDKQPELQPFLKTAQITFWLRLLDHLNKGEEDQASTLIQNNPFANESWEPDLLKALQRIISYRRNGTLSPEHDNSLPLHTPPEVPENSLTGSFFHLIDQLSRTPPESPSSAKIPDSLRDLLNSQEVFSAAFLSAGWREAGLQLHKVRVVPVSFPHWVAFNITEALRENRGPVEALKFATQQKKNPPLSLLVSEMLIANGNPEAGIAELQKLTADQGNVGYRASWLLSLIYIEKKQYKEAKAVIAGNPQLSQDLVGQEAIARIALLEGDESTADKIYMGIEAKSTEAKSYLARKAFAEKNWERAQELTEELLKVYPTNQVLKDNLQKIRNERSHLVPQ